MIGTILTIIGVALTALLGKAWLSGKRNPPPLEIDEALAKRDYTSAATAKAAAAKGPAKAQLEALEKDGAAFDARQKERNK